MATIAPYGTWKSPITVDLMVDGAIAPSFPTIHGDDVYWTELRPAEGGRVVLVRRRTDGVVEDVVPEGFNVRTRVHEYGGRSFVLDGEVAFFSNFSDQRVYGVDPGTAPVPITAEPPEPAAWRFGDFVVTPDGGHLVCVRERHEDGNVQNDLVALRTDGSGSVTVLASGNDFYMSPALSADGRSLAWITWNHPRMPWDGTWLYSAALGEDLSVTGERLVAGGEEESVGAPRWSPDGVLHFVSDRTGWWNLYREDREGEVSPVATVDAEFMRPAWQFGDSSYGFLPDGSLLARYSAGGYDKLGVLREGQLIELEAPFTRIGAIDLAGEWLVLVGGSPTMELHVASLDVRSGAVEVLRRARPTDIDPGYVSVPRAVEFPTEGGLTAHAFYYPPTNRDFEAPDGELPPLIVSSHGGPTSAVGATANHAIAYWASRGFAIVDVNYGGSTGYGRAYRERLRGTWGVVDLDDCINAALYLADQGLADRQRLLIHGGSAGGYTTLCALTFRDVFAAGASYFGVADIGALARDTHKFESRYLDGLIGRWPEDEAIYEERSPIFHTELLKTPMILFQGLEDVVVPPAQAELMASALQDKGVPYAYIAYEGEQHGFRRAENIKRTVEAELYFYGKVLGFEPADDIEPVQIENIEQLPQS